MIMEPKTVVFIRYEEDSSQVEKRVSDLKEICPFGQWAFITTDERNSIIETHKFCLGKKFIGDRFNLEKNSVFQETKFLSGNAHFYARCRYERVIDELEQIIEELEGNHLLCLGQTGLEFIAHSFIAKKLGKDISIYVREDDESYWNPTGIEKDPPSNVHSGFSLTESSNLARYILKTGRTKISGEEYLEIGGSAGFGYGGGVIVVLDIYEKPILRFFERDKSSEYYFSDSLQQVDLNHLMKTKH